MNIRSNWIVATFIAGSFAGSLVYLWEGSPDRRADDGLGLKVSDADTVDEIVRRWGTPINVAAEAGNDPVFEKLKLEYQNEPIPDHVPPPMLPTSDAIALFEKRLEKNAKDHASWVVLGRLQLRQAHEDDNYLSFVDAERSFQTALTLAPGKHPILTWLAAAQNAQHKFQQALVNATRAFELGGVRSFAAAAEAGDACLQMGKYAEAKAWYLKLDGANAAPETIARQSRLAEVTGEATLAYELMFKASELAIHTGRDSEDQAWYLWRLAELQFNSGNYRLASEHIRNAVQLAPSLAAHRWTQAKILFALRQEAEALAEAQAAYELSPEPPIAAFIGDLFSASGDEVQAKVWIDRADQGMAEEALVSGDSHLRERAMFLLNHGRELKEALAMAQADLQVRADAFSYDAIAWGLHLNGKSSDAISFVEKSLEFRTPDASLYFHAGEIYRAVGDSENAQRCFEKAGELNPAFSPIFRERLTSYLKSKRP